MTKHPPWGLSSFLWSSCHSLKPDRRHKHPFSQRLLSLIIDAEPATHFRFDSSQNNFLARCPSLFFDHWTLLFQLATRCTRNNSQAIVVIMDVKYRNIRVKCRYFFLPFHSSFKVISYNSYQYYSWNLMYLKDFCNICLDKPVSAKTQSPYLRLGKLRKTEKFLPSDTITG